MNQLSFRTGSDVSSVILFTILLYYFYYYSINSEFTGTLFRHVKNHVRKEVNLFLFKKGAGFLVLGVIPGFLYQFLLDKNFEKFGLTVSHLTENLSVIVLLTTVVIVLVFLNQRINRENNTLQIKVKEWSFFLFLINCFGWVIYLIGYEFLFRGILLFECFSSFGLWPAIAVNIAINSAIHMVNGKCQTFGAIIFSGVACFFAVTRETILIPIAMHVTLSLFSDYFSIIYNKQLRFSVLKSINLF